MFRTLARLTLAGLLTAGAIAGATAMPASAGPIGVTAGCRFVLSEVKANRLQEANADETYLYIGSTYTGKVKFHEGETHIASEFGTAAQTTEFIESGGRILVAVYESDFPSSDEQLGGFAVYCTPGHYSPTVNNFNSNYVIVFDVVVA
jgi:hypothetical protein